MPTCIVAAALRHKINVFIIQKAKQFGSISSNMQLSFLELSKSRSACDCAWPQDLLHLASKQIGA